MRSRLLAAVFLAAVLLCGIPLRVGAQESTQLELVWPELPQLALGQNHVRLEVLVSGPEGVEEQVWLPKPQMVARPLYEAGEGREAAPQTQIGSEWSQTLRAGQSVVLEGDIECVPGFRSLLWFYVQRSHMPSESRSVVCAPPAPLAERASAEASWNTPPMVVPGPGGAVSLPGTVSFSGTTTLLLTYFVHVWAIRPDGTDEYQEINPHYAFVHANGEITAVVELDEAWGFLSRNKFDTIRLWVTVSASDPQGLVGAPVTTEVMVPGRRILLTVVQQ